MIRFLAITFILLFHGLAHNAFAESPIPHLKDFVEAQIAGISESLEALDEDDHAVVDMWYLRRFLLRIRAKFGFDVPIFAEVKVVPELELYWQKDLPDGWKVYKP